LVVAVVTALEELVATGDCFGNAGVADTEDVVVVLLEEEEEEEAEGDDRGLVSTLTPVAALIICFFASVRYAAALAALIPLER